MNNLFVWLRLNLQKIGIKELLSAEIQLVAQTLSDLYQRQSLKGVHTFSESLKRQVAQSCRLSDVAHECTYFSRSKVSLEQACANFSIFPQIRAKNVGFFAVYSKDDD